jgi:hypothetical protein
MRLGPAAPHARSPRRMHAEHCLNQGHTLAVGCLFVSAQSPWLVLGPGHQSRSHLHSGRGVFNKRCAHRPAAGPFAGALAGRGGAGVGRRPAQDHARGTAPPPRTHAILAALTRRGAVLQAGPLARAPQRLPAVHAAPTHTRPLLGPPPLPLRRWECPRALATLRQPSARGTCPHRHTAVPAVRPPFKV